MAKEIIMAKIENISTLENSSSSVSVTLHENYLKKDGSYYARVSRNTASFKNIISEQNTMERRGLYISRRRDKSSGLFLGRTSK